MTVVNLGVEPQSVFVKALMDAAAQLKQELGRADVRKEIVSGIFSFLGMEFPAGAGILNAVEPVVLQVASIGAK